jgi:hypothetical protein
MPLAEFKPDNIVSTGDTVALLDSSYKKHKHAFIFALGAHTSGPEGSSIVEMCKPVIHLRLSARKECLFLSLR